MGEIGIAIILYFPYSRDLPVVSLCRPSVPGAVTCWVVEQRLSLLVINIEWIIEVADMRADGWGDLLNGNGVAARCGGVVDLGHGAQILTDAHRSLAFVRELDGVEKGYVCRSMSLAGWYQFLLLPWSCYTTEYVA